MENFNSLIALAEKNLGAFAVLAILLLLRYQDRREIRQSEEARRDDAREQSLIDVLSGFVQSFAQMSEKFTATLDEHTGALRAITTCIDDTQALLAGARREIQAILAGQKQLQEGVDRLPDLVRERLVDDFKRIGERLSDLNAQTNDVHAGINQALDEWAAARRRLQRFLQAQEKPHPPAGSEEETGADLPEPAPESMEG